MACGSFFLHYYRSCNEIFRMALVEIRSADSSYPLGPTTTAETTLIFICLFFLTSLNSEADPATFRIVRKF